MLRTLHLILSFLMLTWESKAQSQVSEVPTVVTFKQIDTLSLKLTIFQPTTISKSTSYPAIIFFFGGGWASGNIKQFEGQAQYFASRGMVAILADYRVSSRNRTTPFEAVADAKSAIRYLRLNAAKLNINPERIVGAGGSAGGHLAAAADLTSLEEAKADTTVSARPNVLVLFNPVFNNGPGEYGYDRIGDRFGEISPFHNIKKGAASTIAFFGTSDILISVKTAQSYKAEMEKNGSRMELYLYPNQGHGFFNKGEYYKKTLRQADIFLKSLGYLRGQPTI